MATDDETLRVAISGGSMGGLFTGLALDRSDRAVDIDEVERSTQLRSRGAGIVAQPEMLDFVDDHGIVDSGAITTTTATRQYLDRNGDIEREYGESMTFTAWDALYRRLRDAFPEADYHVGRVTAGVDRAANQEQPDRGNRSRGHTGDEQVTLRFEEGNSRAADLAVIAEGGQSSSRGTLAPDVSPEYAGYVAWRGVTPEESVSPALGERFDDTFTFYEGPDDLVLAYLIPGPDGGTERGERRLNWVWYDAIERDERRRLLTDADGRTHEFSVPPGELRADVDEELLSAADDRLPDTFADLVRATDDRFVQTIYDLSVPRMVFGRACLLGDAAFVAHPHTAAGTAKAAADGIELAEALEESEEVGTALAEWEEARLDASRRLVAKGRQMGENYME